MNNIFPIYLKLIQYNGNRLHFSIRLLLFFTWLLYPVLTFAQNSLEQIYIQPATGLPVNFNSEVDILFVYDDSLLNQLPFTQFDWISSKDEYLDREDKLLELVQFNIVADSELQEVPLPHRHNQAVGILVFASHEDPVAEAIDISFETNILLQIESYGINVIPN